MWLILLYFSCLHLGAEAQIHHFQNLVAPSNRSLHALRAYYVYSKNDAPQSQLGNAIVEFQGIVATQDPEALMKPDLERHRYQGIEVGLIRYDEFWSIIDPVHFCCNEEAIRQQQCRYWNTLYVRTRQNELHPLGVHIHPVPNAEDDHKPGVFRQTIRETGIYILIVSNCGHFNSFTLSGGLVVRNPHGFLPGHEYHKLPFYGWLAVVYAFLACPWLILSLRWRRELFNIQNCIAGVIFLGIVDSLLWYALFVDWNVSGSRNRLMFVLANMSSVLKSLLSIIALLVASLGWGVTRAELDERTSTRILGLCLAYLPIGIIREVVLAFRESHSLSPLLVVLCVLPSTMLKVGLFAWIFAALCDLISNLKDKRQTEKLHIFNWLWWILAFTLAVTMLTVFHELPDATSRTISQSWKWKWLYTDGVSHALHVFVLASMMYLWMPHKNSQRYAYSFQLNGSEIEQEAASEYRNAHVIPVPEGIGAQASSHIENAEQPIRL